MEKLLLLLLLYFGVTMACCDWTGSIKTLGIGTLTDTSSSPSSLSHETRSWDWERLSRTLRFLNWSEGLFWESKRNKRRFGECDCASQVNRHFLGFSRFDIFSPFLCFCSSVESVLLTRLNLKRIVFCLFLRTPLLGLERLTGFSVLGPFT